MTPEYGWVITRTSIEEPGGAHGPRGTRHGPDTIKDQGREFRMLDDDGQIYYWGFYLGPDDESMFGPLDDYGLPNAGATSIEYRTESGVWEPL